MNTATATERAPIKCTCPRLHAVEIMIVVVNDGLMTATVLALVVLPVFYLVVQGRDENAVDARPVAAATSTHPQTPAVVTR